MSKYYICAGKLYWPFYHPPGHHENLWKLSIMSKNQFVLGILLGILIYTRNLIDPSLNIWFGAQVAQHYSHVALQQTENKNKNNCEIFEPSWIFIHRAFPILIDLWIKDCLSLKILCFFVFFWFHESQVYVKKEG